MQKDKGLAQKDLVQKKTFTNWYNDKLRGNLKISKHKVDDLFEDLKDGVLLVMLCEQLAKPRKIQKYNKKVVNKLQAIENLGIVLRFVASENIKLVNIGPEDVYDGNPKLVLGLVWTLIGRYQIRSSGRSLSTKAAMKEWLDTLIPEYGIQNFNTDWNDGRPLCGLVDRLQPGLCSNHKSLDPRNGLENCRKGMKLAENNFDIPPVLDPEDMNNPEVDDLSIMTYLAYFFKPAMTQLLEWIHKKIPQRGIENLSTDWNTGVNLAALMEACHPGLFPNWEKLDPHKSKENLEKCIQLANDRLDIKCPVSAAALSDPKVDEIVVATYLSRFKYSKLLASADEVVVHPPVLKAGCGIINQPIEMEVELGSTPEATLSHLKFAVSGPNSETENVTAGKPQNNGVTAVFVPTASGEYTVSCKINDEEVEGCPLQVPVIDPSTWSLVADLPEMLQVNKPITIQVQGDSHGSTPNVACDSFIDTGNKPKQPSDSNNAATDKNDSDPSDSPAAKGKGTPDIGEGEGPGKERATLLESGKEQEVNGLDKPAIVGEEFSFSVTPASDKGEVDVVIQGPTISYTPEIEKDDDDCHLVNFIPEEIGMHTVDVTIDNKDVDGSPFSLSVIKEHPEEENGAESSGSMKEGGKGSGDDVTDGIQDKDSEGKENLPEDFSEEPKKKAQFMQSSVSPFEDGKCNIYLLPTGPGKAKTHITVGGVDVKDSPFSLSVVDASSCSMSNLEDQTFLVDQPVSFSVYGPMEPKVAIQGSAKKYTPKVTVEEGKEMSQRCYEFTPDEPGVVKISVQLVGGEHVQGSPCTIQVTAPSIISDIPKYLEEGKVYTLDVLIDDNLKQKPTAAAINPSGNATAIVEPSIFKNESISNHWKLELKALTPGTTTIDVKIGADYHVKKSPFSVKVSALSQCRVEGMEEILLLAQPFVFKVIVDEGLTQKPEVMLYTPSSSGPLTGIDNGDNSHTFTFTPVQLGLVKVAVLFGGQDIPGSPFSKTVETPSDAKNCRAYGPSLHPNAVLQTGRPIEFCVDTTKAGKGELQIIAQGPKKHNPKVLMAEENGLYTLRIDAPHPGWYQIHVWWSQVHIPNSPFRLKLHQAPDPAKVRVYGAGISKEIEVRRPAEFYILTKDAGMGTLTVIVHGIKNAFKVNVKPEDPSDPRTLMGVYYPTEAGNYEVMVKWSGTHVPGSPFPVTVTDRSLEIEQARIEERRKERLKRLESQQKIIQQQNIAVQKAIQTMPDFRKHASLSMARGGQFADLVGANETVTHKSVHKRRQRRMVRNASASAVLQTQSLSDMSREKKSHKASGGPTHAQIMASSSKPKMKKSKSLSQDHFSVQSAMQKNAQVIGGSLRGGVTPMWHNSFAAPDKVDDDVHIDPTPQRSQKSSAVNNDLPDELPVTITPLYNVEEEPVRDTSKKRSKRSSKKR